MDVVSEDGALCLDFANTWENRLDRSTDTLSGIEDVLDWSCNQGILTSGELRRLRSAVRRWPNKADEVFHWSIRIRETVFRLLSTYAAGRTPDDADIEDFNRALAAIPGRRLCIDGECCRWDWPPAETEISRVMWPVIQSAAELLTSPKLSRVRECDAPDCSWLFFDTGRGRPRRWCSMGTCGNRAKARRYYTRHRGRGQGN